MNTPPANADAWMLRSIRGALGLVAWTAAWVASVVLANFGPRILWNDQPAPTVLALAFSVVVGVGMLLSYKRYLHAMDELQRTVQLEAMAWTLGAGLVGGVAWALLDRHDLVAFEAEIGHLIAFMSVVYVVGCIAGSRRYR